MIKTPLAALLMATSLAIGALVSPTPAVAQIELTVMVSPPPLPVYEQPPIPGPGYLWLPGYWSYGPYGYFWVPGTWMEPPAVGLLWTPGFWGWSSGFYVWNPGYWAPQIGFYGGVNYGFGYPGRGYYGGEWRDNRFWYNREVNNVTNVNITNVYSRTVVNNVTVNRVSYVGGPGGLAAQPTAEEQRVAHEHRIPPTAVQVQHRDHAAGARRFGESRQTRDCRDFKARRLRLPRRECEPWGPGRRACPGTAEAPGGSALIETRRESGG
jgi:hypothetical protein